MRLSLPTRPVSGARHPRGGFALLITITLLAFIVLLLLGLAVYTRIETSIAGNTQRQAQARENALLGLDVALRQLQLYAGPDTRVTATAQNFDANNGTRFYTGVWSSDPAATATPGEPLTWLISGNEKMVPDTSTGAAAGSTVPAPLVVTPANPPSNAVDLVGPNSTGSRTSRTNYVAAPKVDITATGVPGAAPTANTTIGRYAWWVGDQGVKAPVAIPDTSDATTFAPYDYADMRARIRQQMSIGAGAAATDGAPSFEPRDTNNRSLVANGKVTTFSQLAFLRNGSNAQIGFARAQQNFHNWSPNNFAVIANTKAGGLRQDLSIAPGLLGDAFTAWANYPAYMEKVRPDPVVEVTGPAGEGTVVTSPAPVSTAPPILPAYGDDPLRRRYLMSRTTVADESAHGVAPVLTYFLLTFNVRTIQTAGGNPSAAVNPLEVRGRWMLSLWNPYTSALVPESLRVEVSGLPDEVIVVNEDPTNAARHPPFSLQDAFGSPRLKIALPWESSDVLSETLAADRQSWLPGRVYTWRSSQDTNSGDPVPDAGYPAKFYSRNFGDSGPNQGVQRLLNNGVAIAGVDRCHLEVSSSSRLVVRLYAVRSDGDVPLRTFNAPEFTSPFTTATHEINDSSYQFSYVFRLAESIDTPTAPSTWLTTAGRDLRRSTLPAEAFVVGENGNSPEQYENYTKISNPDRLLDRAGDSLSYNEDVPIFELPRAPLLSLGALQHFRLTGARPFTIGNPWAGEEKVNEIRAAEIFDRFYVSGLVDGVVADTTTTGDLILPNPLLKPLRKPDHSKVTIDDIRTMMTPPGTTDTDGNVIPGPPGTAYSAKFFLQGGAFNLNSANTVAWAAVLRGVRFPEADKAFNYLNVSETTGTADDAAIASVSSTDAQFFRFSQTAQETYKAESGFANNDSEVVSPANTHLFRRGMRTLNAGQVTALAAKIVELIGLKHAATSGDGGPFRSLEGFLTPSALFAGIDVNGNALAPRSLLEAAIADAGINAEVLEFSSQWLTQADVMTALAPTLFPRSDTFVIRTYGEAVNPATSAVEGKAWGEAVVQRVPEYFDRSSGADALPSAFEPVSNPDIPDSPPTSTQAQDLNKRFGRRFKVISFRWLTRSDI